MVPVAAGREGRGAGGSLGKAAKVRWKAGVSVFLRASSVVFPVKKGGKTNFYCTGAKPHTHGVNDQMCLFRCILLADLDLFGLN